MTDDHEGAEESMMYQGEAQASISGMKWMHAKGRRTFIVMTPLFVGQVPGRKIMSFTSQLYEPNGYASPATVNGKNHRAEVLDTRGSLGRTCGRLTRALLPENLERDYSGGKFLRRWEVNDQPNGCYRKVPRRRIAKLKFTRTRKLETCCV